MSEKRSQTDSRILQTLQHHRTCKSCSARQSLVCERDWMERRYRWLPLVGRCKKGTHDE